MCIVSAQAKLSKTKILSMALDNGNHYLAYGNKAQNLSGKQNSMILAIPGELRREWFENTKDYNKFLLDIENQAEISFTLSLGVRSKGIERFTIGMYTVLITDDIEELFKVNHDPNVDLNLISEELKSFFKTHYKGWSFVICVFDGSETMDSQPIAFQYKPFDYNWLYFPTMDSHTGGAPDLKEMVEMDHTLMYEYPGLLDRVVQNVKFRQEVPELLKRRNYVSTKWDTLFENGDMYLNLEELNKPTKEHELIYNSFKRLAYHPSQEKRLLKQF